LPGEGERTLHDHGAEDGKAGGVFDEIDDGDGVVENIAAPDEAVGGEDVERHAFDADIVAFAGTEYEPVPAEDDGLAVGVDGAVFNP